MSVIDLKFLKEAGMHYGHLSHKRHPKAESYILGKQGNIHIINLKKTLQKLEDSYKFVYNLAKDGKKILYVCTKPYARKIIEREAKRSRNHYVNFRWLGGTLTNSVTIKRSVKKLEEIDRLAKDGYANMLKKEISKKEKERKKLDALLGGIRYMFRDPAAVFIIDIHREKIALNEVKKKKIPIIALVDTNVNPELVEFPVPGNDDSPKTIDLFCQVISAAAIEGKAVFEKFREEQKQESAKIAARISAKKMEVRSNARVDVKKVDVRTAARISAKKMDVRSDARVDVKKVDVKSDTRVDVKKVDARSNAKVDEKKVDVRSNAKVDEKKVDVRSDAKVDEKKVDVRSNAKVDEKKVDARSNARVDEKKVDARSNAKVDEKKVDVRSDARVDEKKVDARSNAKVDEKKVDARSNARVDEKKVDVRSDARVDEKKVDVRSDARVDEKKVDVKSDKTTTKIDVKKVSIKIDKKETTSKTAN